ncbi:hypothetical protein DMENIID0001_152570 [Sergentomyia squamirostris]
MPLLDHFCFCCSVRLGVIFTGIYAALSSGIFLYFLGAIGVNDVREWIEKYDVVQQVQDNFIVRWIVSVIETRLELFLDLCIGLISLHLISCVVLIFGALRLMRLLLLPFMILNKGKTLFFLVIHIIAMISLKKQLPLGELILTTCAGGFYILFLLYMWSTSVALYQQIGLINSEKYRLLYGNREEHHFERNITQVKPNRKEKDIKPYSFKPFNDDANMLYRDFMTIYSRKRE